MTFLIGAVIAAILMASAAPAPAQLPAQTLPPECLAVAGTRNEVTCNVAVVGAGPGSSKTVTITIVDDAGQTHVDRVEARVSAVSNPVYDGSKLTFKLTDPSGIRSVTITVAP